MSVLQRQHQDWLEVRHRLGHRRPVVRPIAVRLVITGPVVEVVPYGCPIDLLSAPSMRLIAKLVSLRYGLALDQITSSHRGGAIMLARHEAIFLVRVHTMRSYHEIGRFFGGRDHSTMVHSVASTAARDPRLMAMKIDSEAQEAAWRAFLEADVGIKIAAGRLTEAQIANGLGISFALVHSIAYRWRKARRAEALCQAHNEVPQAINTKRQIRRFRGEVSLSAGNDRPNQKMVATLGNHNS